MRAQELKNTKNAKDYPAVGAVNIGVLPVNDEV